MIKKLFCLPVLPALILFSLQPVSAEESLSLPELQLNLAAESCTIIAPTTKVYRRIAEDLAQALGEATGTKPIIVADTQDPAAPGSGPLIVLGNLMDSVVARTLYLTAYDFTDYAFPGPDGYVVRTIRDPFGTGAHVILAGGSEPEGVAKAAQQLVKYVLQKGAKFGYLNDVQLGRWTTSSTIHTAKYLNDDDAVWNRVGKSGSWIYMASIAGAGLGYLRTGNEAYLPLFKREMFRFLNNDVYHHNPEAPQMLHGFVHQLLVVWDLIRDHPTFTQEDREKIDKGFLYIARSGEGPGRIASATSKYIIRGNHGTRTGLDAFFCGRYFSRRFKLAEAETWLAIAEGYFKPQLASGKPICDSWGHQWKASLFNTLVYAMAAGKEDYFNSESFRTAADRALIAYDTTGPRDYLSACAVAAGDTGYLTLEPDRDAFIRDCAALRLTGDFSDEILRTFTTGEAIRRRTDLLGVSISPVDKLWYDTIDATGISPKGLFVRTVPLEHCFDKISIREGWSPDDFYLLLDGISGGHHSFQDGNCLVRYRESGALWLASESDYFRGSMSIRAQNGVSIGLNAEGPGHIHRFARLLYAAEQDDFCAIGAVLDGVGKVDWERHILRKQGSWTLIIDRVIAHKAGELLAERFWYPLGENAPRKAGLVSTKIIEGKTICFHLLSAGLPLEGMTGLKPRIERIRAAVTPGGTVEFATLLWVSENPDDRPYTIRKTGQLWRVRSKEGTVTTVNVAESEPHSRGLRLMDAEKSLHLGNVGPLTPEETSKPAQATGRIEILPIAPEAPAITLPFREAVLDGHRITAVASHGNFVTAGTESGLVVLFDLNLCEKWRSRVQSKVLSLDVMGDNVLVGEESGALSLFAADGRKEWTVEIPWVTLPWAYWSEQRSRIREITTADLDGDGATEILVSNADRRVYAFDRTGKQLWKRPIEWGVFTAMTTGKWNNETVLMGGTSRPSIHGWCIVIGTDGTVRTHFRRPDITSWSVPTSFMDMQLADIDGDGTAEVVCALDTNCNQLIAYNREGAVKWDIDVAGAANAVAVDTSRRRVLCAAATGYVVAVNGATGKRLWACYLGEPPAMMWVRTDGTTLASCAAGRVYAINLEGTLTGCAELGGEITSLSRPGDHRSAGAPLLLGTGSGKVLLLGQEF